MKLYQILAVFDAYALNRFRKYVASPFFNEQTLLIQLLEVLSAELRRYKKIKSDKTAIWAMLFDSAVPYSDVKWRRICSDLSKLAEDFIAYEYQSQHVHLATHYYRLKGLLQHHLPEFYETATENTLRDLAKYPHRNAHYAYEQYHYEVTQHEYKQHQVSRNKLRSGNHIPPLLAHLDDFYVCEKLRRYCEWLNDNTVLQTQTQTFLFIEPILQYAAQKVIALKNSIQNSDAANSLPDIETSKDNEHSPNIDIAIVLYYHLIGTLTEPNKSEHFDIAKTLLRQYSHLFPPDEATQLYGYAQNYCARQINAGEEQYVHEVFGLYKESLQKGLIFDNGTLSPWHYKNIVVAGCRLRAFDWVETFISDYQQHLPPEFSGNAYVYNMAKLHFHKGDYNKVITLLQSVEYQDVFYALDSRGMLVKIYYERDEEEALLSLLVSFGVFLRRNKTISATHRVQYNNFLAYTEKIWRTKAGDKERIERLKQQIINTKQIANAKWLLQKLIALE